MKTVSVKVLKRHPYKGPRAVGEVYDCPAKLARVLVAVGKAEPIDQGAAFSAKTKENSIEEFAKTNGVDLSDVEGTGSKGKILKRDIQNYLTRDLKAKTQESDD